MPRQRAGKLRHRIVVETFTETVSNLGEVSRSWSTSTTRWASIKATAHREEERNRQIEDRATHWVTMRHVDGLSPNDRLKYGSRVFNILSVDNVEERDRKMLVRCVEVV